MNDDIDLTEIPEGSVLLVFDRSAASNRLCQAVARSGKRLYVQFARPPIRAATETKPFYWISAEEAEARRESRFKQWQDSRPSRRAERVAESRGRNIGPNEVVVLDHTVLDVWAAKRRRAMNEPTLRACRVARDKRSTGKAKDEPTAPDAD